VFFPCKPLWPNLMFADKTQGPFITMVLPGTNTRACLFIALVS
jgi:hypothetical protein